MRLPIDEHRDLAASRHSGPATVHPALGGRRSEVVAVNPVAINSAHGGDRAAGQHSHLAAVYLALTDDVEAVQTRRSVPRGVCAVAAGVVLALAAPLAWASPAPRDQPAATVAGKAAGVELDEDADGPWPAA